MRKIDQINTPEVQASWYVARIYSGEMTAEDEHDLFCWLEADPAHRRAYRDVLAMWDALGELGTDPKVVAAGRARTRLGLAMRSRAGWAAVAATILVVSATALVAAYFIASPKKQLLASFETAVGEQRVVDLEDGSRATLNTASRLLVDYTSEERRMILDFGEVFFEAETDPGRPLTVSAGGHVVTALGTKFSVFLGGNDLKVAVVEGVVAVGKEATRFPLASRPPAAPVNAGTGLSHGPELVRPDDVILRAGAMATFSDESPQIVEEGNDAIERIQRWREGTVRFDSEPLYRVVGELNRYSRVKILIEDDTIVSLPISGVFRLDRVDLILDALQEVVPVEVIRHADRYVLVGSSPDPPTPVARESTADQGP